MSDLKPASLSPARQVAFHQLLVGARKTWLSDGLREVLRTIDPVALKTQLAEYVPGDVENLLASAGIRDEYVFPTPVVLEAKPTLGGYYRLLLGISQKSFYRSGTGMGLFQSMEIAGRLTARQQAELPAFCAAMGESIASLVRQLAPTVAPRDLEELSLLTLGAQFQGSNNVAIGKQATQEVFLSIVETVKPYSNSRTDKLIVVTNSAGRDVRISLESDPDVRIQEQVGSQTRNRLAIEIKGGTDVSNAHNRAGEAEKSHQKARGLGYRECWTIIMTKSLDREKLKAESPTTNLWFDAAQVLARTGQDWEDFKSRICEVVGIPNP